MELDGKEKLAVEELGKAVNDAIKQSQSIADAIEHLREMGFVPNLSLKLEIDLEKTSDLVPLKKRLEEETDLDLTDEDKRTLQRMKIII